MHARVCARARVRVYAVMNLWRGEERRGEERRERERLKVGRERTQKLSQIFGFFFWIFFYRLEYREKLRYVSGRVLF